jgi:hypothetical protein
MEGPGTRDKAAGEAAEGDEESPAANTFPGDFRVTGGEYGLLESRSREFERDLRVEPASESRERRAPISLGLEDGDA